MNTDTTTSLLISAPGGGLAAWLAGYCWPHAEHTPIVRRLFRAVDLV